MCSTFQSPRINFNDKLSALIDQGGGREVTIKYTHMEGSQIHKMMEDSPCLPNTLSINSTYTLKVFVVLLKRLADAPATRGGGGGQCI